MKITIELKPETEAGLAALAAARGVALPQYLRELLESQLSSGGRPMSGAQRAAVWRASAIGLPISPPLSDESISRSNIYGIRG